MRPAAVLLFLCIIQISTRAYSQTSAFDCHERNVTIRKVLEVVIRKQTGYLFFSQNVPPQLLKKRISLHVTKMPIDTFLKNYLGVGPGDYKLEGMTYWIKRVNPIPPGINPPPPPGAPVHTQDKTTGAKDETLPNVEVVPLYNGYQKMFKERATGSFGYVDRALINRSVSTGVTDRLENLVPGVLSDHAQSNGVPVKVTPVIRGQSTLYANPAPLVVLDNFPYDGDINNINPNDVESITVLKDAAAASIWGVRAGNGVIVYNTRRSKVSDSSKTRGIPQPVVSYNSSLTFQPRADLYNVSSISSADAIDRERALYDQGYYTSGSTDPVTPVIGLLNEVKNGVISSATADALIGSMKTLDVRKDLRKYLYRNGVSQQHFLQASASSGNAGYYFSAGWDHDLYGLTGSSYDRISMRLQTIFKISEPLQIETGVSFIHNTTHQDGNPGYNYRSPHGNKGFYPYAQLADGQGNPLPLYLDYNPDYLQAATQLGFPDWTYAPLKDKKAEENTNKTRDLLINLGARYTLLPSLNVELKYQYENIGANGSDLHYANSYYARDLVNSYLQVDPNTNSLSYPIPQGGILDFTNRETTTHQGRIQVNYNHSWSDGNNLAAIGGYEVRSLVNTAHFDRQYGYDPGNGSYNANIDYAGNYATWQMFNFRQIPSHPPLSKLTDHFISYYANASYTYHDRYILSASAREDAANLFGVKTNQKKVPLWSTGVSWQINNEEFYHLAWLSSLKLRATYGRSGNISRLASAYTTASYSQGGVTGTPYTIGSILGLSNPNLRWEQVGMFNLGMDFATKKNIISGTLEYYRKKATDLMAPTPGDPTLGLVQYPGVPGYYYGNTGSMIGSGIDCQLESHNLAGAFKWTTNLIFSRTISRVDTYLLPVSTGNTYLDQNIISPRSGRPLYALYSFKWMGLDASNGDPLGYYKGKSSNDWTSIYNSTAIDSMVYNGPTQPTIFGALRNTFQWRHFTASFNISYKFGYYFRKPSISYSDLYNTWTGNGDYARRWQHTGDEMKTHVPSAGDPGNNARDFFYLNSSVLVEKADHIRLEDIQLSYELDKEHHRWLPGDIRLYSYISNLGLLWKANKSGIDPYYINIPKEGRRYSFGVNINF